MPEVNRQVAQSETANDAVVVSMVNSTTPMMPTLLLTNINHIMNKLDELYLLVNVARPVLDIIAVTESWLTDEVPNSFCDLPDYTLFRRDRTEMLGGGVLCYVRNELNSHFVDSVCSSNFDLEVLMVSIRPRALPRPLSLVLLIVVYCPPWFDAERKKALSNYITLNIDYFESVHPNTGFLIAGDFNSLDTKFLNRYHGLKQIVTGSPV